MDIGPKMAKICNAPVASQLSVSLRGDQSKLNGKHVVLGRVVQGMEAPWKAMESTKKKHQESTKGKGP